MSSVGKSFQAISVKLVLPLVVLLFPIIIVQAYFHYDRFEVRRAEELKANLQMARALGVAFNGLVQDVLRQELAIAVVVMDSPSPLPPVLPKLLRESAQSHPVRSFSWVSPEGRVLVSSNPMFEGIDISDREYFKELASGREWYVSDLVLSKASGKPIFSIARSVRDSKGDLLGFVSATLNAQVVEEVFGFERPKDAGVSLTDRNGMVVATYPAKEFTWDERNWLKLYPEKLGDPLKGRETTAVISTSTGKKRLVGAAPVPSVGWVAASSRSEDAVLGATQSALVVEGTLFLIVTLAAFATALAVSRPISRSVQRLRGQVLALGRGDKENLTIYPSSTRELNELAQSFSRMAEEVRNRENALRDNESRLRAIFESTEEAIITLDDEQRCLEANPAAGVITGVPHEQLVGRFLREFIDSYGNLPFTWESIPRTGPFKGEVRIRHSSGSLRILEASGVAHVGPGRHLFVGHDITDRKKAEEALRESEAKFRLIAENTADVISQHDADYRILYVSPSAERVLGYSPEELIGNTPDIATPEDALKAASGAIIEAVKKGSDRYRVEHRMVRKEGTIIWVETNGTLIYDWEGRIKGVQCIVRDISDRKSMEEALKASEERYRHLFKYAPTGIYEVDFVNRRFKNVNEVMCRILGYTEEELLCMDPSDLLDEDGRKKFAERIRKSIKNEEIDEAVEYRIIARDGREFWSVLNVAFTCERGRVTGALVVAHDITERRKMEETLRNRETQLSELNQKMADALEKTREGREDLNRAQALARIGSWRLDVGQNTLTWSDETYRMFGIPQGTPLTYEKFLSLVHPDDREYVDQEWSSALKGETYDIEHRIIIGHSTKWVREKAELEFNEDGSLKGGFGAVQDITERKQAEANRALLTEILRILNRGGDMQTLVSDTLRLIRDVTGFDAVGMRLRKNEDCPYFAQVGFSEEFLREENFLCEKGLDGAIVYDQQGRPLLECTCGVVLSGRIDPSMSCFTKAGSFWTNASHELLALPPEADPRTNPRNRCIHAGYESVGLFPVRSGREIVGLLQLNGRAPGRFTPGMITFYENLAQNIGLAIQRTIAEESLREKDRLVSADLDAMTRLQKIGALFVSENNLEIVLEKVVKAAIAISGADFGNIQLLDPKSSELRIAAQRGFPEWWIESWKKAYEGHGSCGTALKSGERVIIEDVEQSPIFIDTPVLEVQRKAGVRAVQSTPLLSRSGKLLGIFSTHYKTVHRPDDRTLRLLDLLARNAADIIEHTQAEEALRKSRDELESRVRERTAELEAKNQELQDFSYIASHDLSEPLRKIETFGSILESKCKDRLDSQAADYLSRMTGAANRMKELLEALLRYSRVGTRGDQFRPVRLNEIAKDAAGDLEIPIRDAGVGVEIGQLQVIYGDPYQWRQVFQNLIGNAAKYHRSEIKPFIRIYGEEVDRAYRIFIEDNGIGFDEKYLDKIFQPFQRLHGRNEYPGTGIGLAICRKIVERHGGTITATSTPGKGSTFIIELPTLQKQH